VAKTTKSRFAPPFGGLRVTYTFYLWLVWKRVVDVLLVLTEMFCQLLRSKLYERISVEIVVFKRGGWVTLRQISRGEGALSTNYSLDQKTRVHGLSLRVVCVILRLSVLIHSIR